MSILVPFRALINRSRRWLWRKVFFRMLFGEMLQGRALPYTRISPSTCIEYEDRLHLADDVFIGHFNFIEASSGISIGTGTQVTNFISIVSHSTHRSVRVASRLSGLPTDLSDIRQPIAIGDYCFIGPHSVIEAGTTLGKGCLVTAGSRVRGHFPDFAVLTGNPAQVVGDTRNADARWLDLHPEYRPAYESWAGQVSQL